MSSRCPRPSSSARYTTASLVVWTIPHLTAACAPPGPPPTPLFTRNLFRPPFFPQRSLPRLPMLSALPCGLFLSYPLSSGTRPAPAFLAYLGSTSPGARFGHLPRMLQSGGPPPCFCLLARPPSPRGSDHHPGRIFQSKHWVTLRPRSPWPLATRHQLPPHWAPPYLCFSSPSLLISYLPDSLPPACHQALPLLVVPLFLLISRATRLP